MDTKPHTITEDQFQADLLAAYERGMRDQHEESFAAGYAAGFNDATDSKAQRVSRSSLH